MVLRNIRELIQKLSGKTEPVAPPPVEEEEELCCNGIVHIAYRGISDDRMYVAYSRKWQELRFFRQNNLRVFCADCRRRLL